MYTVILVDDEKHCIIDLEKSIPWETFGYKVVATYTVPEDAEAGIMAFKPDLVFVDIKMPRIGGLQLIEDTKKMGYEGDFIIVSGYDDFDYVKGALKKGIFDYCLKPIDDHEIINALIELGKQLKNKRSADATADTQKIQEKSVAATMMNQIIDYVNLNIHRKLSVGDVCDQFNISSTYCTKLFNKYLNKSFTKYLTECRMDCAKKLLVETGFNIQEIASRVGIEDYYYFSKKFKEYTKMTPTECRQGRETQ